jgi:ElaB/YqjD/DUF883 family membrane-anchored ribosome-binding protein
LGSQGSKRNNEEYRVMNAESMNGMDEPMKERVTAGQLIDDLQTVIGDAENLLRETAEQGGDRIREVRRRAEESVKQAKERLAGLQDEAIDRAQALAGDTNDFVRSNPWQAVGIAAGVGLVLGILLMSRR